jgi:hypothetical protein
MSYSQFLDPPMTDIDPPSALTSHYEPRVQQGLLCGNFKCTQGVLGYLSKMHGLNENRDNFKAPRRDYPSGDFNTDLDQMIDRTKEEIM